tara:strand:+ start:2997 stop:3779 length:783 start_codon:yes stop_codon:yes gene_type:complete
MVAKKTTVKAMGLSIESLQQTEVSFKIIGTAPLIYNSMSLKAQKTLLMGAAKKTAAEKKEIKHNPEEEFVDSCYINGTNGSYLSFPSTGIKRGMATAALETAGVTKASINRGIYVVGEHINVWGKPYMNMSVVRSSDINRTPDIRTRAKLPNWCTEVTVRYINPTFSQLDITALLVNAGTLCGLGDWRIEKGGPMGGYRIVQTKDDQKIFDRLVKEEGATCQKLALENPEIEAHDNMSHELYEAITQERLKRAAIIKEVA